MGSMVEKTFTALFMGAFVGGPILAVTDLSYLTIKSNDNIKRLVETARTSCALPDAQFPDIAKSVQEDCAQAVKTILNRQDWSTYRQAHRFTLGFVVDEAGKQRLVDIEDFLKAKMPEFAQQEYKERVQFKQITDRFEQGIRNIVANGVKPFENTFASIELRSLLPVVGEDGKDTGRYTGQVEIASVDDRGNNAIRIFTFERTTGKVSITTPSALLIELLSGESGAAGGGDCEATNEVCRKIGDSIRTFFDTLSPSEIRFLQERIEGAGKVDERLQTFIDRFPTLHIPALEADVAPIAPFVKGP